MALVLVLLMRYHLSLPTENVIVIATSNDDATESENVKVDRHQLVLVMLELELDICSRLLLSKLMLCESSKHNNNNNSCKGEVLEELVIANGIGIEIGTREIGIQGRGRGSIICMMHCRCRTVLRGRSSSARESEWPRPLLLPTCWLLVLLSVKALEWEWAGVQSILLRQLVVVMRIRMCTLMRMSILMFIPINIISIRMLFLLRSSSRDSRDIHIPFSTLIRILINSSSNNNSRGMDTCILNSSNSSSR